MKFEVERNTDLILRVLGIHEPSEFYSKALFASLPIAADLVLNHQERLQAQTKHNRLTKTIANLAASLAYELSMNWDPQIEVWAKLEKKLGLTKPKSGADITGTDGGPDSGFSLN